MIKWKVSWNIFLSWLLGCWPGNIRISLEWRRGYLSVKCFYLKIFYYSFVFLLIFHWKYINRQKVQPSGSTFYQFRKNKTDQLKSRQWQGQYWSVVKLTTADLVKKFKSSHLLILFNSWRLYLDLLKQYHKSLILKMDIIISVLEIKLNLWENENF